MKEDMVLKKEDVDFCDKPLPTLADIMNAKKYWNKLLKN